MIWPRLEARAEIPQKICLFFGRFEDSKIFFWNYLTFKAPQLEPIHGVTLKSMLILGDRRMAKLRRFWKFFGVKIPSRTQIQKKEEDLMVPYEINEAIGKDAKEKVKP